jgi:hypothetical protein
MNQVDQGGINVLQVAAAATVLDGNLGRTQLLALTENVTISGANNFVTGEVFTLIVKQDATGNWTLTWPADFKGALAINLAAFGVTTFNWASDELGNYYPLGPAVWS